MLFPDLQNYRALMAQCSQAIDASMGELVTVTPTRATQPNFPAITDPSKAVTVTAVFTSKAKTVLMGNEHRFAGHSLSPLVSTSEPIFSFGYDVVPFAIQQSFRITRLCSGETFEVTDVKPDGVARIVVHVNQLDRQREDR